MCYGFDIFVGFMNSVEQHAEFIADPKIMNLDM